MNYKFESDRIYAENGSGELLAEITFCAYPITTSRHQSDL